MARVETLSLKLSPAHLHYTYCMFKASQSIASVAGLTVSLPRSLWTLGPWPHASSAGPAWQCLGLYLLTAWVILCLALQQQDVLTPLLSGQRCPLFVPCLVGDCGL